MRAMLEAAAFRGQAIDVHTARHLIQRANDIIHRARGLAGQDG
jgi:hypothetical protein